jgi:hypothetical protein
MVLRSYTPDGVQQEVYGFLLVHYAVRTLMHQAALDADIDPRGAAGLRDCWPLRPYARSEVTEELAGGW